MTSYRDVLQEAADKGNLIDLGNYVWKGANDVAKRVLSSAETYYRQDPQALVFYVRDPKGLLDPKVFVKESYRLFAHDPNDDELYADGPEPHGGVWNYEVSGAGIGGFNRAVEQTPPSPRLEPVQGKTGKGWRVTIAKPYQYYLDASEAAEESAAAELAKKGYYPKSPKREHMSAGSDELRAKYYALGQKAKKAGQPFKTEATRPALLDRMRYLAGITR